MDVSDPDDLIVTANNRVARKLPNLNVRGMDEREILALAPLLTCDRVHWDTVGAFDAHSVLPVLEGLGISAYTRQWSDGQHRVWVPAGRGFEAREVLREWCTTHDVEAVNMRVEQKVPFRDIDSIPGSLFQELVAAAVEWLYPRVSGIRHRLIAELDIVDEDDVKSMMYLFISDHADRYDADRQGRNGHLNFAAYMLGKLRNWPQDAARAFYGRTLVDDRLAIHQATQRISAAEHRPPTERELADALDMSVADLRRRRQAISSLSSMRNYDELVAVTPDGVTVERVDPASDADTTADVDALAQRAAVTRALLDAVDNADGSSTRRGPDSLGLAATYLAYWEGLNRAEVARALDVLPKTATAAINRVGERMRDGGLR